MDYDEHEVTSAMLMFNWICAQNKSIRVVATENSCDGYKLECLFQKSGHADSPRDEEGMDKPGYFF